MSSRDWRADDVEEWRPLLDWAGEVATRVRAQRLEDAGTLSDADVVRYRELIAAVNTALDRRDAAAFRAAVGAYGSYASVSP